MTDGQLAALAAFGAAMVTGAASIVAGFIQRGGGSRRDGSSDLSHSPKQLLVSTLIIIYISVLIFFTAMYCYGRYTEDYALLGLGRDGLIYEGIGGLFLIGVLSELLKG